MAVEGAPLDGVTGDGVTVEGMGLAVGVLGFVVAFGVASLTVGVEDSGSGLGGSAQAGESRLTVRIKETATVHVRMRCPSLESFIWLAYP